MNSVYLLDINVLIARLDADHEHHEKVTTWWHQNATTGWATCPITENGFIRILGRPTYPGWPGSPDRAAIALNQLVTAIPGHRFFADEISLLNRSVIALLNGASSSDVTDLYLLSLAVFRKAKFVTLDARIKAHLVPSGLEAYTVVT